MDPQHWLLVFIRGVPVLVYQDASLQELGKSKTTKLILLDSLLQEVEATLPHLVLQKRKIK